MTDIIRYFLKTGLTAFDKKAIILLVVFIGLCGGGVGFLFHDRSAKSPEVDSPAGFTEDEDNIDYARYLPFAGADGINPNLIQLDKPADVSFTDNYPKLDGAAAAFPVYASIVQELYENLDEQTVGDFVACSRADEAYERLINGEIDILFGAQPSGKQIEAAKERGVEFVLTPIAREAFVFFVNNENPVTGLTLEQIQGIYQKQIVDWSGVGGNDETIIPFQRPKNSGSQNIMLSMVMGDKPLPAPLSEELTVYKNHTSAIGYSFRYFVTKTNPIENIRLLSVDGIKPTTMSIRNGIYPFVIDFYAVTAGSTNENADELIQWILSEQGQDFVSKCGYVKNPVPPAPVPPVPIEREPREPNFWDERVDAWQMAFGFADDTGHRFLCEPSYIYNDTDNVFDPAEYSLLIGAGSEIFPVGFDARQGYPDEDIDLKTISYFDRQAGYVYVSESKQLAKNRTYLLTAPGPLVDALVPFSPSPPSPWYKSDSDVISMGAKTEKRIAALKGRGVDYSEHLGKTEEGGEIGLVLFERFEDEAMFSIVYTDDTQTLFWDNPTAYIDYAEGGVWRVDTVGPGYFDILFLARFDEGLMLMLNWGGLEGEIIVLLFEENDAFAQCESASLYSRYFAWVGYLGDD